MARLETEISLSLVRPEPFRGQAYRNSESRLEETLCALGWQQRQHIGADQLLSLMPTCNKQPLSHIQYSNMLTA
jgi:hypothetical protein